MRQRREDFPFRTRRSPLDWVRAYPLFALAGIETAAPWPYFAALAVGGLQLVWQVWDLDMDDPRDCLAKFKSNRLFSWLFLAGIMAGYVPGVA